MILAFTLIIGGAMVVMACLWAWQQYRQDAGIVDVGWAYCLGGAAVILAWLGDGQPGRRWLLALLAGCWSLRLGTYLLRHRILRPGVHEDGRYQRLRQAMGTRAGVGFLLFFQFQAWLVPLFALPYWVVARNSLPLSWLDAAGVVVGLLAIVGETLADRQLARFRSEPTNRGHTCQTGLWRYSRHPNYFFEWLQWFAYILLAWGAPWGWLAWSGPVVMFLFLWKLTGMPFTEQQALSHRADYADYQRRTSPFIPWIPKSRSQP
jgi:steroid 5-alpha reductase family enzyme